MRVPRSFRPDSIRFTRPGWSIVLDMRDAPWTRRQRIAVTLAERFKRRRGKAATP